MATASVPNNPPGLLPKVASTGRALFVGLLWAAVMLVVFGLWMRSKYDGRAPVVTAIFLIGGLVAAVLAYWQTFTLWVAKGTADQKLTTLTNQQRLFSYVFLAGGLGLVVMAFVVGVAKKDGGSYGFVLENFGETVGCLLFGLISLSCGYVLQMPREESGSPMDFLVGKLPILKLSQVVIGAICLVTFVYLGFVKQVGFAWFPELAALVFMSMLCVSCFFLLNTGSIDEFGVRLFVLLFGGLTGLILFFLSIGRAIFWKQDIFLGGIVAWQGPDAWHFWLCAYLFFASLVLMAVSFNLGRADIRASVVLRRVMYGYDAIVQTLLVVGILAVMNVCVYAMVPFTYDWTKGRGIYDLSPSTKNLISGLKKDVSMIVLLPQTTFAYRDMKILTDNMQALSKHLIIKYVSPDADFLEYEKLADKFPQIMPDQRFGGGGRGVLLVNGVVADKGTKDEPPPPYAFIAERKLSEFDRQGAVQGGRSKYFFKGEAEIMKELKFLLQDRTKRKIYILQGDDEPNFADERNPDDRRRDFRNGFKQVGMGIFTDKLKKDNYDVFGLTFQPELPGVKGAKETPNLVYAKAEEGSAKKDIPKDCKTLVVAGVSRPLASETIDAIDRYMERGGKMIVFLDVIANEDFSKLKETGLEPLLRRFGVEVTDSFALSVFTRDPREPPPQDARELEAGTTLNSPNPLPKQFAGKPFFLQRSARILKIAEAPGRFKAEPILELYPVGETNARPALIFTDVPILQDPDRIVFQLMTRDKHLLPKLVNEKSVILGAAVTNSSQGDKPSLVVFGDTEFITNRELAPGIGKSSTSNYNLVAGCLDWLAERSDWVGSTPRENSNFQIKIDPRSADGDAELTRMILLPGWLMLLTIIGLGIGVWITRRR